MLDFKLLAIRPRKNCNPNFLKNLDYDRIYQFYNDYSFFDNDGIKVNRETEVSCVNFQSRIPSGFYDVKTRDEQPLSVNISAVVGKNGSGKSTLVDLLLVGIYIFSNETKVLYDRPKLVEAEYERLKKLVVPFLKPSDEELISQIRKQVSDGISSAGQLDIDGIVRLAWKMKTEAENSEQTYRSDLNALAEMGEKNLEVNELYRSIKLDLYYQLSGNVYVLRIGTDQKMQCKIELVKSNLPGGENGINPGEVDTTDPKVLLSEYFFYTIGINYSQFGLNANITGQWINSLFHKNDGYKTPVVINPMRTDGYFDVNNEMSLAKYRLLSNVLIDAGFAQGEERIVPVTEKQSASRVIFSLDREKVKRNRINREGRSISGTNGMPSLLIDLYSVFFSGLHIVPIMEGTSPYQQILEDYIIQKIDSISSRYDGFRGGYKLNRESGDEDNLRFLNRLFDEESHITFKLKQALNFLQRTQDLDAKKTFFPTTDLEGGEVVTFDLPIKILLDFIGENRSIDLITFLPPSIFSIDIVLIDKDGKTSPFESLSSGEQQLIHAVQSVLYHIRNLQSAHYSAVDRIRYGAINIIYDEIELYFHPDFQRKFTNGFLKALEGLRFGDRHGINAINILFLTHSPFILSDIPENNILKLGEAPEHSSQIESRTFAANIHDLLGNKFFLSDSLMGEFADKKISELIERISSGNKREDDDKLIAIVGDSFLRAGLERFNAENL